MTDFLGKPVDLDTLEQIIFQYAGIDALQTASASIPALGDD